MKTVEEWLNLIPQYDIRTRALNNMYTRSKHNKRPSMYVAIGSAFNFNESKEGCSYWIKVREQYKHAGSADNLEIF